MSVYAIVFDRHKEKGQTRGLVDPPPDSGLEVDAQADMRKLYQREAA